MFETDERKVFAFVSLIYVFIINKQNIYAIFYCSYFQVFYDFISVSVSGQDFTAFDKQHSVPSKWSVILWLDNQF